MTSFEFFFSFYGLLLGLSLAELVSGFARAVQERRAVRFGLLTPLLALFVAIDISTFWVSAWAVFRGAPFNLILLVVALLIASIYYLAASLVFPRDPGSRPDLDEHFMEHRRLIFLCILTANLLVWGLLALLLNSPSNPRPPILVWVVFGLFGAALIFAALAPGRRSVLGALLMLTALNAVQILPEAVALARSGPWKVGPGEQPAAEPRAPG